MTSGNFSTYPLESITIARDERQRGELRDIEDLADSLRRNGLINPIVITQDGALVAGERRLTAAKSLGWTHIAVQFAEDLDPLQLQLIELEENTKRVDLDWKDQCRAVDAYHSTRKKLEPDWNATRTAEAIGVSSALVSQYLGVARELRNENKAVAEAPKFSVARGIVARNTERAKASALQEIVPPTEETSDVPPLIHSDFIEWSKTYTGTPFNFIHCDFPYGIGADKHDQGNAAARGGYADSADTYYKLIEAFSNNLGNFCEESAHVMFWFSMEYYEFTYDALSAAGFKVLRHPLVWVKSDNSGILPDHRRQPRRVYETALLGSRGDRQLVGPVANAFSSPNIKSIHMSEKPKPVLAHFFRMFVDEYTTMLDPTCGSANAVAVAQSMGAHTVLGIEGNEEFYKVAVENYDAT